MQAHRARIAASACMITALLSMITALAYRSSAALPTPHMYATIRQTCIVGVQCPYFIVQLWVIHRMLELRRELKMAQDGSDLSLN